MEKINCLKNVPVFSDEERAEVLNNLNRTFEDKKIGVNTLEGGNLPRRGEILEIINKLLEIVFPGYDDKLFSFNELPEFFEREIKELELVLFDEICRAMKHGCKGDDCSNCNISAQARESVKKFLRSIPEIRDMLKLDVHAAYVGDPAAMSYDEIILSYPCIKTIAIQRFAHLLYLDKIPLIPRMMTEYAHSMTGIDIHPGATLGKGVFIDHGTGVVVGETAAIGNNVRIYQGVTLGALSFPKDACGMLIKGKKRHPTIEDNVTIYAGATVLGDITIGSNSVIGGNVWVTESLAAGTKITAKLPEHFVKVGK